MKICNIHQGGKDFTTSNGRLQYAELVSDGHVICNATLEFIIQIYADRRDQIENYFESVMEYVKFNNNLVRNPVDSIDRMAKLERELAEIKRDKQPSTVEGRNFNWYVREYFRKEGYLHEGVSERAEVSLLSGHLDNPLCFFEIKIGLLKFICDDLNVKWGDVIRLFRPDCIEACPDCNNNREAVNSKLNVCPAEFLESIFK